LLGWVLCFHNIYAQPWELRGEELRHYNKISQQARHVPDDVSRTPYHLSKHLTKGADSDLEKVRAIYIWLANNITYDMQSFEAGDFPDPHSRQVLKKREALCEGYARLFRALCSETSIRCEIIRGYSKGYGYEKGSQFEVGNHAWNAVKLAGTWYLVDATWAATTLNTTKIKRPVSDDYFLAPPREFLITHLPEISAWQLVDNPISLASFEQGEEAIRAKTREAGNYQFEDSLNVLLGLDASLRKIEYQRRVSLFNPRNTGSNYYLGVEYLYRGLDSLELLKQVEDRDITIKIPHLEIRIFNLLDEAAFHFYGIKPSSRFYESAQNFLDETTYEKGVFKYEVAHRLLELFGTFNEQEKVNNYQRYEQLVNQYFAEAKIYFSQIPTDSWYYEDAMSYVNNFLVKQFNEL